MDKFITRKDIRGNPKTLYVFGDNVQRRGYGGQAKVARGEPNTFGLATKWSPTSDNRAYFKNNLACRNIVESDLRRLREIMWKYDDIVVFPGIGEGLAKMQQKAPELLEFIKRGLQELIEHRHMWDYHKRMGRSKGY